MSKQKAYIDNGNLAVFGTGSEVGKSVVATAICRHFVDLGMDVAPFKAQNMSNNSGVTPEGLEMGRAQIVQAEATRRPPHVDMNPILLKPTSDIGAQVVLLGEAVMNCAAGDYHLKKKQLFRTACQAYDRLRSRNDLIVIEGAGSCAEVNLMPHDIVNFRMAEYADAPVLLVADIHRGGVFAQIIGTLECLSAPQRERIIGVIINRFRGDAGLFRSGVEWLERKTGKPVFGVLPWYDHFKIESEDSVSIENPQKVSAERVKSPAVAVVRLPHIANFTDFDPLSQIKGLSIYFLEQPQNLAPFGAVILPGSKNTRGDLEWLQTVGWDSELQAYHAAGGHLLGICGGYQMLGAAVRDPDGLEGMPGTTDGLGLLPVETVLKAPKTTTLTHFMWQGGEGQGYEIHMGQTDRHGGGSLLKVLSQNGRRCDLEDGCLSADQRVIGTYMHGFFDSPGITARWLKQIGLNLPVSGLHGPLGRDRAYEQLAAHFAAHVNLDQMAERMHTFNLRRALSGPAETKPDRAH